jgi:polyhydroxyalkanoate synthesis regulator phasin
MIDLIKKTVLAGIGATVTTKEKIEGLLDEYVEKGKLSATEAKSLATRIAEDGKQEFESAKNEFGHVLNDLLKKANVVTHDEIAKLERRVAKLEGHAKESHSHPADHSTHAKHS